MQFAVDFARNVIYNSIKFYLLYTHTFLNLTKVRKCMILNGECNIHREENGRDSRQELARDSFIHCRLEMIS